MLLQHEVARRQKKKLGARTLHAGFVRRKKYWNDSTSTAPPSSIVRISMISQRSAISTRKLPF
jgi:hypothetical protein